MYSSFYYAYSFGSAVRFLLIYKTSLNINKQCTLGSVCSPILANIYLDKLDKYLEQVINRDTSGKHRKINPKYNNARYRLKKAKVNGDSTLIKPIVKELKSIPSVDAMDAKFRRVYYVRYADYTEVETMPKLCYIAKNFRHSFGFFS